MFAARVGRACAGAGTGAFSLRICHPDLYPIQVPLRASLVLADITTPGSRGFCTLNNSRMKKEVYPWDGFGHCIFSNRPMKKQMQVPARTAPLMYRSFSTFNGPSMKKQMQVPARTTPLMHRSFSTFNGPSMKKQAQLFKASMEKLLLYAKMVSVPIIEEVKCLVYEAVRTVWLVVTGLVLEYFWHVKKGFKDQVSHYHFVTFVAVISSFVIYIIEKFNLRSHFEFLFKDSEEEDPIDLAKEMRDMKKKLNELAELSDQDRQAFINLLTEVTNEVEKLMSEVSKLKVSIQELENRLTEVTNKVEKAMSEVSKLKVSIQELEKELWKLKEQK